eukprot:4839556-Amphidinium_carterae.1
MRQYLAVQEKAGTSGAEDKRRPLVTSYLSTVLLPLTEASLRNTCELLSVARCSDCLIRGQAPQCLDILLQRFQAVETSHAEAGYGAAKHFDSKIFELVPEAKVSCVPIRAKRAVSAAEMSDQKQSPVTF